MKASDRRGGRATSRNAQVRGRSARMPRRVRERRLPHDLGWLTLLGALLILAGLALQGRYPEGFPMEDAQSGSQADAQVAEIYGSGPVRINELMSANTNTLLDDEGLSADWIEVINVGSSPVSLAGYALARSEKASNLFTFPEQELQPGECAIVFADSTLRNEAGEEYHAPFRLPAQGGSVMLFNPSGSAVDSVNFPALEKNVSYARREEKVWAQCVQPTPGLENSEASYQRLTALVEIGVQITEILPGNTGAVPDADGMYYDYIELHNPTEAAVDLSGWFLSDSADDVARWRLPQGFVLQPGEYRLVYASGLDRADGEIPHASFRLSPELEGAVLSDPHGRVVDRTEYDLIPENQAWSRRADGSWAILPPTPGAASE